MTGVLRSRWTVLGVVVVALVASLALVGWQWRHPQAFREGLGGGTWGPVPLGKPVFVGMSHDAEGVTGVATIHDVRATIAKDTAGTKVEFLVCQVDASAGLGSIGSIIGEKELDRECLTVVPAEGARLRLGRRPVDQILMSLTLTKPGRIRVTDVTASYSHGWQRGSESLGGGVRFRATEPAVS